MKGSMFLSGAALIAAVSAKSINSHAHKHNSVKLSKSKATNYMEMNPEHVAILLRDTQQEWVDFALHEKADTAAKNMEDSCKVVAQGMVNGSDGDKDRVEEYFHEVCSTPVGGNNRSPESHAENCNNFAQGLLSFMTNDPEENRNNLDATGFCAKFWTEHMGTYVQAAESRREAETARLKAEHDDMTAQQKRSIEMAKETAMKEVQYQDSVRLANVKASIEQYHQHSDKKVVSAVPAEKTPAEKGAAPVEKKTVAAASTTPATRITYNAKHEQVVTPVAVKTKAEELTTQLHESAKRLRDIHSVSTTKTEIKAAGAATVDKKTVSTVSTCDCSVEKQSEKCPFCGQTDHGVSGGRTTSLAGSIADKFNKFIAYFTTSHNSAATKSASGKNVASSSMADLFKTESTYMMHQQQSEGRSAIQAVKLHSAGEEQAVASSSSKTMASAHQTLSAENKAGTHKMVARKHLIRGATETIKNVNTDKIKAEAEAAVDAKVKAIKERIAKKFAAKNLHKKMN